MSMKLSYRDTLAELVRELKMKKKVKRGAERLLKSLALFVEVHKVVEVVVKGNELVVQEVEP